MCTWSVPSPSRSLPFSSFALTNKIWYVSLGFFTVSKSVSDENMCNSHKNRSTLSHPPYFPESPANKNTHGHLRQHRLHCQSHRRLQLVCRPSCSPSRFWSPYPYLKTSSISAHFVRLRHFRRPRRACSSQPLVEQAIQDLWRTYKKDVVCHSGKQTHKNESIVHHVNVGAYAVPFPLIKVVIVIRRTFNFDTHSLLFFVACGRFALHAFNRASCPEFVNGILKRYTEARGHLVRCEWKLRTVKKKYRKLRKVTNGFARQIQKVTGSSRFLRKNTENYWL